MRLGKTKFSFIHRLLAGGVVLALIALPLVAAEIPRKAPDLVMHLPSGKALHLSQFKGKVVALEFLLTTCPHCKRTSSTLQRVYQDYASKGFQPLGAAFNVGAEKLVAAYSSSLRLTYPVGAADRYEVVDFLQHPILLTLWTPQLVIIDKKGMIRGQYPGTDTFFRNEEQNLRQLLDKLLAE